MQRYDNFIHLANQNTYCEVALQDVSVTWASAHTRAGRARAFLREVYGYDEFRAGQAEIVDSIASGRDVLAVMSTGFGKSVCFQVPALMYGAPCIVVTPIIALMEDQVHGLRSKGVGAETLHSGQTTAIKHEILNRYTAGRVPFLYLSPEMLTARPLAEALKVRCPRLVVVDEAHCVSQWGADFRPDYSQIYQALNAVEAYVGRHIQRVAFTGTATAEVRSDIARGVGLRDPKLVVGRVRRPNLAFRVAIPKNQSEALGLLLHSVQGYGDEAVIVYCMSIKKVEMIAEMLAGEGIACAAYHGRMNHDERRGVSLAFTRKQLNVIVATDAFGMGIDRPDVRCVINFGCPLSIEHYVQQSGRAGRDGNEATCLLISTRGDAMGHDFFLSRSTVAPDSLSTFHEAILSSGESVLPSSPKALMGRFPELRDIGYDGINTLIAQLTAQGILSRRREGKVWTLILEDRSKRPSITTLRDRNQLLREKSEAMLAYATAKSCRAQIIERYLGGDGAVEHGCGKCQFCVPHFMAFDREAAIVVRCIRETGRVYGVRILAAVLCGRREHRSIRKQKLDGVATFGALRDRSDKEVRVLIRNMMDAAYLHRVNNLRAGISETSKGERAYLEYVRQYPGSAGITGRHDTILLADALRSLRARIAREYSRAPESIWSDEQNAAVAVHQPRTLNDLQSKAKFSLSQRVVYGGRIVEAIETFDTRKK